MLGVSDLLLARHARLYTTNSGQTQTFLPHVATSLLYVCSADVSIQVNRSVVTGNISVTADLTESRVPSVDFYHCSCPRVVFSTF